MTDFDARLIERIARGISETCGDNPDDPTVDNGVTVPYWKVYAVLAEDVVEFMQEFQASPESTNIQSKLAIHIASSCGENPYSLGDARGNEFRWQDYLDTAQVAERIYLESLSTN